MITTIEHATPEQTLDAADLETVTRADVHNGAIRLFAGKKVQNRLPLPEGAKVPTVEGILAALTYPTSETGVKDRLEEGLEAANRRSGSVIPDAYRYAYGVDQNNGDQMAQALKDYCGGGLKDPLDVAKLEEVVDQNGIRDRFDVWLAKDLNPGMLRMNTGNVLRGKLRKGDVVRVGQQVWNEAPKAEA